MKIRIKVFDSILASEPNPGPKYNKLGKVRFFNEKKKYIIKKIACF